MGSRNKRRGRAGVVPKPKVPNVDGLPFSKLTNEQRVARIQKHGITPEAMADAVEQAYWDGFNTAGAEITRTVYAALMLMLNEEYGFGTKRLKKALSAIDQYVKMHASDGEDEVIEVYRKFGIVMKFRNDDLFEDRVRLAMDGEDIYGAE